MRHSITLPPLVSQRQLQELLPVVSVDNCSSVVIDFTRLRFITPVGVVFLASIISRYRQEGITVSFGGITERLGLKSYLQRVDFFRSIGVDLPEKFNRHDPRRRFLPLQRVGKGHIVDVSDLAIKAAECIAPELRDVWDPSLTGHVDCLEYCVSEIVNNVQQHSLGTGYIMAQYYPRYDSVTIAIADSGIGIAKSLGDSGWGRGETSLTDIAAINLALQPGVSSKAGTTAWGESVNAGVGLSILSELARQSQGEYCILTGAGMNHDGHEVSMGGHFHGTLVAFRFTRANIMKYPQLLEQAKLLLGLGGSGEEEGRFE